MLFESESAISKRSNRLFGSALLVETPITILLVAGGEDPIGGEGFLSKGFPSTFADSFPREFFAYFCLESSVSDRQTSLVVGIIMHHSSPKELHRTATVTKLIYYILGNESSHLGTDRYPLVEH